MYERFARDHPRLRGEYVVANKILCPGEGSPPLARGIQLFPRLLDVLKGITPACAGNTDFLRVNFFKAWDHPRLRGEYLATKLLIMRNQGSPPLARGIRKVA